MGKEGAIFLPDSKEQSVAGSDLEDIIKTFAKIKNGRACIALTRERNNSNSKEKIFIWPKRLQKWCG